MPRRNLIAELMSETIVYGGCRATQREVYDDCIARGLSWRMADLFACGQRVVAVDPSSVSHLPTLAQIRAWEESRGKS